MVKQVYQSCDDFVGKAEVEYQNHSKKTKRTTVRGVRELVVIKRLNETSIDQMLFNAKTNHESDSAAAHVFVSLMKVYET